MQHKLAYKTFPTHIEFPEVRINVPGGWLEGAISMGPARTAFVHDLAVGDADEHKDKAAHLLQTFAELATRYCSYRLEADIDDPTILYVWAHTFGNDALVFFDRGDGVDGGQVLPMSFEQAIRTLELCGQQYGDIASSNPGVATYVNL